MSVSTEQPKAIHKRFVGWYVVGVALMLAGIIAAAPVALLWLFKNKFPSTQFVTPGSKEVEVLKPGKYFLWFDYQTIYQGQSYNFPEEIPGGLGFKLTELSSQKTIEMSTDFSCKVSSGGCHSASVGHFQIQTPGKYLVKVDGDSTERIFSFSGDNMSVFLKAFLRGAIVASLGIGAGLALCGIGLLRQLKK